MTRYTVKGNEFYRKIGKDKRQYELCPNGNSHYKEKGRECDFCREEVKKMSDGYEAAKEAADKIKADNEAEQEKAIEAKEQAINALATVQKNEQLAQMYRDSASVGAENLGGALPLLKVHATGKSTGNLLADGKKPNDGYFFYTPEKEQFESVECHILTISKGFHALGIPDAKTGKRELKFNQIMGGVIVDGSQYKPFIFYFTGTKLQNLWKFGAEASQYTKAKPMPIPMFALTVKLTTKEVKNDYSYSWMVEFEIEKESDGSPKLVTDPGEFQFLKDSVASIEETINSLIANKAAEDAKEQPQRLSADQVIDADEVVDAPSAEDVAEDIPF